MAEEGGRGRVPSSIGSIELLEAFASAPRAGILEIVSRTPSSVQEIARKVGLKPISVRFHLQKMLKLNLVEEVKQRGSVGRPRSLYRATKRRFEVAFPPRNYAQLASILLQVLLANPDQKQVSMNLRKVGARLGSELGRNLKGKAGVGRWSGASLKKHLVEGLLEDFGAQPETVRYTKDSIQYRLNNCPFKELATEYPQVICEQLDDTVNISLLRQLDKGVDWRKLKCIGHGDAYCEYIASLSHGGQRQNDVTPGEPGRSFPVAGAPRSQTHRPVSAARRLHQVPAAPS